MFPNIRLLTRVANAALDALLPDQCALCQIQLRPRPATLLCPHCLDALPYLGEACMHCALPLAPTGSRSSVCGACMRDPLTRGIAVCPLEYDAVTAHLVQRFKFHRGLRERQVLAQVMLNRIRDAYGPSSERPQALIAMPMSYRAQVSRGDHPVLGLTQHLGDQLGIPVKHPLNKRHGPPQREKTRAERLRLKASTFTRRAPLGQAHVALIDDVMTTGRSARMAAQALVRCGAQRVDVWCIARAV